jgi:GT2 family glycosyltransferase
MAGGEPRGGAGVAVVLLNYRAEAVDDTASCVESLRAGTVVPGSIIVVDNGAPAEVSDELLRRVPEIDLLRTGENLGFTGGNNRGIERALAAGFAYVWVLNNDTVVEPECLERLLEALERETAVGAVCGKILYFDHPERVWYGGGHLSLLRGIGKHEGEGEVDGAAGEEPVREVSFVTGCCMLLPAGALRAVRGFEEDFFAYVEDVELSLRLRRSGFRLLYAPGARLYHRIPMGEEDLTPWKIVMRDRNRRRLVRRRYRPVERAAFGAFFYPTRLIHAVRYAVAGDWERLRAIGRGLWAR